MTHTPERTITAEDIRADHDAEQVRLFNDYMQDRAAALRMVSEGAPVAPITDTADEPF